MSTTIDDIDDPISPQTNTATQSNPTQSSQRWNWFDEEREGLVDLLLELSEAEQRLLVSRDNGHEAAKNKMRIWNSLHESFKRTKQLTRSNNAVCTKDQLITLFKNIKESTKRHFTKVKDYTQNRTRIEPPSLSPSQQRLYEKMSSFMPVELRPLHNPVDSDGLNNHFSLEETLNPDTGQPYTVDQVDENNQPLDSDSSPTSGSSRSSNSSTKAQHEVYMENSRMQSELFKQELAAQKEWRELMKLQKHNERLRRQVLLSRLRRSNHSPTNLEESDEEPVE